MASASSVVDNLVERETERHNCGDPKPSVATENLGSSDEHKHSYREIVKSSALIGGSQMMNVVVGVVRTKILALLLGPGGFGLAGVYNSIVDLTQNVAGLGVNSSGVRQIAEATGSGDAQRVSLTVAVLRRTSVILGALGALALILFSRQISLFTFGTKSYSSGVTILSIAAFCKLVSGGQGALLQGMRRIADLAKMNVFGALLGAVMAIGLVYFFREKGIAPYLVAVCGMSLVMSWWYSRKVNVESVSFPLAHIKQEAGALLKLGLAFMISSMMTLGVGYAVRVIVLHKAGISGAGLYQSAWTLGGLYVGFILQAMGADFYPRLTAHVNDHAKCNRLVNEQAHVGLLLATPGVIATLTFAPLVIATLYSSKFAGSVPILRWICLGAMLQVITWPMGFIIVAKGRQNLFILSETAWAMVSLLLTWACVKYFGITGAGIAFCLSYVFHGLLIYPIVRSLSDFRWSRDNLRICAVFLSIVGLVFWSVCVLPQAISAVLGSVAALLTGAYSARWLFMLADPERVPSPLRRLAHRFGILNQV